MDGFSVASLHATCGTLSHRALSTSVELDDILEHGIIAIPVSQKLKSLSAKLDKFKQAVEQLRESLNSSPSISDDLQHVLPEPLAECDRVAGVMSKQVKRIGPETPTEAINLGTLDLYEELLTSYTKLFFLETQLLAIRQHERQNAKLCTPGNQQILARAEAAAEAVKQAPDILLDVNDIADPPIMDIEKAMAASSLGSDDGFPPSFEEAVAGSLATQSGSGRGESSSGKGGFMSSLQSGLKAITAAMRPKPEPFVSALCQAAARGDIPQVRGLLGEGANINGRNEDGNTALIAATMMNQVEAARFLLSSGADHTVKDSGRKSKPPFFHALEIGSEPLAELYLARGVDVNEKSIYGQPFLVDVIENGNVGAIKLLLKRGADPNTTDRYGNAIITLATKKGNLQLVKLLLEYGANVNACDIMGQGLVVIAFLNGRDDIVKLLLSRGADPNSKTNVGTPLIVEAAKKNNTQFVKALLERGASANVQDLFGTKLLSLVLKNTAINDPEKEKIVKLLLTHGANPNETDSWGQPSLFPAVLAGDNPRLVKMFLEHGANPNAKQTNEDTYLLNAMDKGNWDLVKLLLQYGANPNEPDKAGRTALLLGLQKGKIGIVKLLVQHGVDVNKPGSISPLAFVRAIGDTQTEKLLRLHGAHGKVDDIEPPLQQRARAERAQSPPPDYDETQTSGS